jgi:hypothetical protein
MAEQRIYYGAKKCHLHSLFWLFAGKYGEISNKLQFVSERNNWTQSEFRDHLEG